jgi:hypothetical protein
MGASVSSNVVNAVSNVTSDVQNLTKAQTTQIGSCIRTYNLDECVIKGNLDINDSCNIVATSNNIVTAIQHNNLNNVISQKLAQEAAATVGTLGLGFADANNTANAFVNSTGEIANSVYSSANQNAQDIMTFNCRGGTVIDGNVIFNVNSDQNFLSDQVLQNKATNQIIQNISQDVTQKATATVAGISGFIIALAIILVAIGWILFKPLEIAMSNRVLAIFIVILIIMGIILIMYLYQLPPFFKPATTCIATRAAIGGCTGDTQCVAAENRTIRIPNPPIRYAYNIIGQGDSTVDPTNSYVAGLLQLSIAKNGGWTVDAYNHFQSYLVPLGVPNPLIMKNDGTYMTNVQAWQQYINDDKNAANARFVLSTDLQIDTYARIFDYEKCSINGQTYSDNNCYKFVPDTTLPNLQSGTNSAGSITGKFGYCDTRLYHIQKFITIGGITLLVILIIVFAILMIRSKKSTE